MKIKICYSLLLFILFAISCKEQDVQPQERAKAPEDVIEFLVNQGFDRTKITFNGREFIIEGDMIMSIESVRGWMSRPTQPADGRIKQMTHSIVINPSKASTIRYAFQHPFSSSGDFQWWLAARRAIRAFIDMPGTAIEFVEVNTNQSPDIVLSFNDNLPVTEDGATLARAELPLSPTTPGRFVEVDRDNLDEQLFISLGYAITDVKQHIMAHEIGHTLGLKNTNENFGSLIPCTPNGNDDLSVLNATIPFFDLQPTYSAGDVLACQTLWPDVNNIISSPTGYTEFGQTFNIYWNASAIPEPQVRIKVWQGNIEHPTFEAVVANDGHHALSASSMFVNLDFVNVTKPDRDTEVNFNCLRISIEAPTPYYLSIFDFTPVFTAHYSDYL